MNHRFIPQLAIVVWRHTDNKTTFEIHTSLSGALKGAAAGAALGSAIPGVGTTIGAVVGGGIGFIFGPED